MDNQIFFFFYNLAHQSQIFDGIVSFFAVYFIYIVIISALLYLFFYYNKKEFIFLCVSLGLAWVFAKILKILFHTQRPFEMFSQVQSLFSETGYAFPSGHTMVASAIAFSIFFTHKKVGYIFIFFALLIGLARIIAGVHFPIDILGGFVLGLAAGALVAYFRKNV
ncbi:MAG: phosphatase PAP2 family protein [Patescibacteria group bacterium]